MSPLVDQQVSLEYQGGQRITRPLLSQLWRLGLVVTKQQIIFTQVIRWIYQKLSVHWRRYFHTFKHILQLISIRTYKNLSCCVSKEEIILMWSLRSTSEMVNRRKLQIGHSYFNKNLFGLFKITFIHNKTTSSSTVPMQTQNKFNQKNWNW